MKTIEELAKEYAHSHRMVEMFDLDRRNDKEASFITGFYTAIEWVSVEDNLPDTDRKVLIKYEDYYGNMSVCVDTYSERVGYTGRAKAFSCANVIAWRELYV